MRNGSKITKSLLEESIFFFVFLFVGIVIPPMTWADEWIESPTRIRTLLRKSESDKPKNNIEAIAGTIQTPYIPDINEVLTDQVNIFYPTMGQSTSGNCWGGLRIDSNDNVYPISIGGGAIFKILPDGTLVNGVNDQNYFASLGLSDWFELDENEPLPHRKIQDLKSMKFGAGARLYGLPGDLTSPSRFLRAAAYASTARKTPDGKETMYEIFRILDNFNLTVGTAAAEGGGEANQEGMRSSTIWTTAYDTKNLVMQYHTMHNRRVRQIDFANIDFNAKEIVRIPLDREKTQDIEYLTMPNKKMMAGGWSEGQIDKTTEEAVAFVLSRMNSSGKLKRIVQVKKQVVKGMNYDITFELDNNSAWNAVVYRNLSGEYSITKVSSVQ